MKGVAIRMPYEVGSAAPHISDITPTDQIDIALVVGGRWHDLDFARLQLLALLGEYDRVHCTIHADYSEIEVLEKADAVIAYTCDVRPTAEQSMSLAHAVRGGTRLLALHATNSAIDAPLAGGPKVFGTPDAMPEFTALLGNRFLAHPKIAPTRIEIVQPEHPLVAGVPSFVTTDELYVMELRDDLDVILDTEFTGDCPGFEVSHSGSRTRHPVLFTRVEGEGEVVYFTLGHCRGRFDVSDLGIADTGVVDRVAWESAEYRKVLRRCVAWAVHGGAWQKCLVDESPDGESA
jgi:type 1 glutamine amidotransferase